MIVTFVWEREKSLPILLKQSHFHIYTQLILIHRPEVLNPEAEISERALLSENSRIIDLEAEDCIGQSNSSSRQASPLSNIYK